MKLSIGKAWEEASAFLAREGRLVAPVALALFALPSVLLNWAYPAGEATSASGAAMLALLLVLVAAIVGQMTIVLLASGWRGSIGAAIGQVAKRVPALMGAVLITFVPLLLIFTIGLTIVLMAAGITEPAAMTPETLAKVPNIGWMMLLFLVAVMFAGVRLFPLSAIAANETVGPVGLLKRSWALTKGHFGRLLALLLLLAVAMMVLSGAVAMVAGALTRLTIGEARPFNLSALLNALAGGIVTALGSSVAAAMIGRVYTQLAGDPAA